MIDDRPADTLDDDLTRTEQAVLGAAMQSAKAYEEIAGVLAAGAFYVPAHEAIWSAICTVMQESTADNPLTPDPLVVAGALHASGDVQHVPGGMAYLHTCFAACVTPANARFMAAVVAEEFTRRQAIIAATRVLQTLKDRAVSVYDTVGSAPAQFEELAGTSGAQLYTWVGDRINETLEVVGGERDRGLLTGLTDLDKMLGGFTPGQVIVCGARPGVGKSVVAATIAKNVASAGTPVLMFSMEMTIVELNTRLLCSMARVDSRKVTGRAGQDGQQDEITDTEWLRISDAVGGLSTMPLAVCEETGISPDRIGALVGSFKRKNPNLGLVVIDYLQLIEGVDKAANRQEAVAAISRKLKRVAMRYQVPILLLAQLNRKSEDRADRRPVKSDLRESGAVEQDADVVILLHREDAYEKESPRAGEADLIVAKHRNGPTDVITVAFQGHYQRFVDMQV